MATYSPQVRRIAKPNDSGADTVTWKRKPAMKVRTAGAPRPVLRRIVTEDEVSDAIQADNDAYRRKTYEGG